MKYRIVRACHNSALEYEVNNQINAGWTPLGGVCAEPNGDMYQAMVMHEPMTLPGLPEGYDESS